MEYLIKNIQQCHQHLPLCFVFYVGAIEKRHSNELNLDFDQFTSVLLFYVKKGHCQGLNLSRG